MTTEQQPPPPQGEAPPPPPVAQVEPKKKEKAKPEGLVIPPKKPKLTKQQRRELQEQQRAAKAAAAGAQGGGGGKKGGAAKKGGGGAPSPSRKGAGGGGGQEQQQHQSGVTTEKERKDTTLDNANKKNDKTVSLFSHLPPYQHPVMSGVALAGTDEHHKSLHPAVLELGLQYAQGSIRGGNARCRAMLMVFDKVLQDYTAPPSIKDVRQHLDHAILKPSFSFWAQHCRPHSISMGNAFTFLKSAVATLDRDMAPEEMVEILRNTLQAYIRERIHFADQAISKHASSKIVDGDVLLTFAHSEVVDVLLRQAAAASGKTFRVVVVDSRPLLEGKRLLCKLRQAGIDCCYILLNSLSYVMKDVTKVFLGAAALMSDGSVLSRVGTACVALLAQSLGKPVLVCCETYKISNRVQLESITGNELGNPDDVVAPSSSNDNSPELLQHWRDTPNLKLLNLMYDLTPSEFVSGIVTEMGILPPTSVAVLLREMNPEGRTN